MEYCVRELSGQRSDEVSPQKTFSTIENLNTHHTESSSLHNHTVYLANDRRSVSSGKSEFGATDGSNMFILAEPEERQLFLNAAILGPPRLFPMLPPTAFRQKCLG